MHPATAMSNQKRTKLEQQDQEEEGEGKREEGRDCTAISHEPTSAYTLEDFHVLSELETPCWLFDPYARKNVWANTAAAKLYEKGSVEDFLKVDFETSTNDTECFSNESSMKYVSFCDTARQVVEGSGRREVQGHLPSLESCSPHAEYIFTISFKRITLLSLDAADGVKQMVCLISTESARLFDSVYQSLRALEILKSSPIFSFLFTCEGKLLTANPRAFTYYKAYLPSSKEGLTLQEILSVGDWTESGEVTYPDDNGPKDLEKEGTVSKKIEKLCEHIVHILFVEKFESYRIQMRMPKRQDPSKLRWAEFEMWTAEDPVSKRPAILVNQTNLQETKKLEMDLKDKHDILKQQNKQLQVELVQEKMKKPKGFLDLDSTVDRTVNLLDGIMAGKQPSEEDILNLKEALTTRDLRAPNRLEEVLLSNKKGFEGEVGLSLFEMLKGGAKSPHSNSMNLGGNSVRDLILSRNNSSAEKDVLPGFGGLSPPTQTTSLEDMLQGRQSRTFIDQTDRFHLQKTGIGEDEEVVFTKAELKFLETVDDWFFDAFELEKISGGHPLSLLSCYLFKRLNLLQTFGISEKTFYLFARKIESGFPDNAYHNRIHVSNVVQSMYILLTRGLGPKIAGDKEIMAGLLAAIIHDYEHKGVSNDFLVRFQDELAVRYNDSSPLENHHIAAAYTVMMTKPYDIFANLDMDLLTLIRKLIVDMVLATDMKKHFDILGRFRLVEKKLLQYNESEGKEENEGHEDESMPLDDQDLSSSSPLSSLPPSDISLALQVALKCADIGHIYCNSNVHLKWVQKLEQEFFAQGDREEDMGASTKSPLMDRDKAGITKSQCGFFQVVVVPLFKSFKSAFPSVEPIMENLQSNMDLWQKIEEDQLEISEVFRV